MAVMMERFIRILKFDLNSSQSAAGFKDKDQISAYAVGAVDAMQRYGILNGYPDGTFKPKGTASRAGAAKIVASLFMSIM
jgi:hypothetical protein